MNNEEKKGILENDYLLDLSNIKETIRQNRNKAMVVVNSAMIMTYYEIGTIINKRKTWGSKYIQRLANDLKEYGKGYSYDQLKKMSQFANEFTQDEIRLQPATQIPWWTLIIIISKSKSHEEMLWYINETHRNGWSRAMVLNQIAMKSNERSLIEPSTTPAVKSDDIVKDMFKDTYSFNYIDEEKIKTEKDLKGQMIGNIIKLLDELERTEVDNETIGLLLCKDADKFVAETTLKKSLMKLGISKYKILEELPEYLERKLNEENRDEK